jgi:hypothetical protein
MAGVRNDIRAETHSTRIVVQERYCYTSLFSPKSLNMRWSRVVDDRVEL